MGIPNVDLFVVTQGRLQFAEFDMGRKNFAKRGDHFSSF
jgi:hypothetical protein